LAADFWKMTVDPEVLTRTTPTLGEILSRDGIRSVYQPIVDIASNSVTGYEALSRGPAGTSLESPLALFGQARKEGRLTDLDWACRAAALRGGLDSLSPPLSLFLNIEPAASARVPDQFKGLWRLAGKSSKVIAEITERALTDDPAALLRTVAGLRELGWGIALDDVGADPRSLAMLPFLHPDVIKLDLRLIQDRPSANIAQVVHAVLAEVERSGTAVLAEGIETHEHLLTALAMGATLGQGWLFGPGTIARHRFAARVRVVHLDRR
jgi:EAL domain-containing protein (putative c-di-GMP-specific phosphodiesterase class I)